MHIKSNNVVWMIVFLLSSAVMSISPLIMASYWGARNFLYCYYFLIAACVVVVCELNINNRTIIHVLSALLASAIIVWGSTLVLVYRNAALTEKNRAYIISEYNKKPSGILKIPRVKYESFFYLINPYFKNNNADYHVITFKKYWKIPQKTNIDYIKDSREK